MQPYLLHQQIFYMSPHNKGGLHKILHAHLIRGGPDTLLYAHAQLIRETQVILLQD